MERPPLISIVCAWYNRPDYLKDTLDSLLAQTAASFEIVLVNDGSKDPRVRDILATYNDPRLVVIHQENAGFVAAIRNANTLSRGRYIAIQGAGDISEPERIALQAKAMDADPRLGVVGCLRRHESVSAGTITTLGVHGKPGAALLDDFLEGGNPFSHGEVMIRREAYDQVGGYRPFFMFAQDRDLWIRIAGAGWNMSNLAEVLYVRRNFAGDGVSTNKSKLYLQQAFSTFARQCHYDRVRDGHDAIDLYGVSAGLFRRPHPGLAHAAAKIAIQSLYAGEMDDACLYAKRAQNEKRTLFTMATRLAVNASVALPVVRRLLIRVIGKRAGWEALS
jgi:glycosyltransferase involved in cell wall biosynthesis